MSHVHSFKKFQSSKIKEDQMIMGNNPTATIPQEYQSESDSLSQEEAELLKKLANVKERRIALDKKINDSINKNAKEMADQAQHAANTAQQMANQ